MPHLTDILSPDRWPLTWALSVALAAPDDHDAWTDLMMTTTDTADRLACSSEALGYLAAPLDPADCRWYRARAGHDFGDLDYGHGPVRA